MARAIIALLAAGGFLAQPTVAEVLQGEAITQALSGQRVTYQDGSWQSFAADGSTLFHAGRDSAGHWAQRGDQYCSVWPPSDRWACYQLEVTGKEIRFRAEDGSLTIGTLP